MQQSLWLQTAPTLHLGSLQQDLTCNVCIVGGGLSGLYTAHLLSANDIDTTLVEWLLGCSWLHMNIAD